MQEIQQVKKKSHTEGSAELVALRRLLSDLAQLEEVPGEGDPELIEAAGLILQRFDEVEETVQEHSQQLESLKDVTDTKTTKEEKVASIIQFGENQRGGAPKWNITAKEIRGVTGVSRRYAYDLIEDIAESYDWAELRDGRTQPSAKNAGETKIRWKKAVQIDYELLHSDHGSVNKFTTSIGVSAD